MDAISTSTSQLEERPHFTLVRTDILVELVKPVSWKRVSLDLITILPNNYQKTLQIALVDLNLLHVNFSVITYESDASKS